jgi:hypothetical protein
VKKTSLETANDLGRKMPYDHNITEILEINRKPFRYDSINKEDIMNRLNLLTADNMYAIFHSKSLKAVKDKNPSEWKVDHYYSKSYLLEKLSDEKIKSLNQAQKPAAAKLGYPPENKFMPKSLQSMKSYKTLYKTPAQISNTNNSQIYYKQDENYASPMAGIRCKIVTTDLNYPKT